MSSDEQVRAKLEIVELNELADRCEAAVGPDRELDAQIVEALGYTRTVEGSYHTGPILRYYGKGPLGQVGRLKKLTMPKFTASLDAAMTLLDDRNWTAWELRSRGGLSRYVAEISRLDESKDEQIVAGEGRTPALALCAAALRSLATKDSADGQ